MTEEMISEKIDRLNSVIGQLMSDLDGNSDYKLKLPVLPSVQNSFFENSCLKSDCFDPDDYFVPQEFIDRFQETLTHTDRLGMILEDLQTKQKNDQEKLFEIIISTEQMIGLKEKIQMFLETSTSLALFRLTRGSLEFMDIKLVDSDVFKQLKETQIENFRLKNEVSGLKTESMRRKTTKSAGSDLRSKLLEVEKKLLELRCKEQELDRMKEDYGFILLKAEILIDHYEAKSRKLDKKVQQKKNVQNFQSQDFTRTRTPVSIAYPLSTNLLIPSFFQYKQQIEEKLTQFETLIKQKYKKKSRTQSKIPEIFQEFQKKDKLFLMKFEEKSDFEEKEAFLSDFLKDSREFLKKKAEELKHYQNFLMENWVKANGEPAGLEVIKKYSSSYFQKLLRFSYDREIIEDRYLRFKKIEENVKKEVKRLQEHRRKIISERQYMQVQQKQIEKYLMIIANLNSRSIHR